MDNGKQQVFPYSMRTVAKATQQYCQYRFFFQITPPTNALTIENLFTHLVFQFDGAIAVGNQILLSLGITDSVPLIGNSASYQRRITINQQADGNRRIDIAVDLTTLLKKATPSCYIEALFPSALALISNIGSQEVWKADALYTTTGIR